MNGLKERPQQAERVRLAVLVTDRWVAYYVRRYVLMFFPISQRRLLARSSVTRIARPSVRPSARPNGTQARSCFQARSLDRLKEGINHLLKLPGQILTY